MLSNHTKSHWQMLIYEKQKCLWTKHKLYIFIYRELNNSSYAPPFTDLILHAGNILSLVWEIKDPIEIMIQSHYNCVHVQNCDIHWSFESKLEQTDFPQDCNHELINLLCVKLSKFPSNPGDCILVAYFVVFMVSILPQTKAWWRLCPGIVNGSGAGYV